MNDGQLLERLRADMSRATAHRHLDPAAGERAFDAASSRRHTGPAGTRWGVAAAAAVVIAVVVGVAWLVPSGDRATAPPGATCNDVRTGPLPGWADSGFARGASAPYVLGEDGRIVAILFGTLHAPARGNPHNKVLWVARGGWAAPLVVQARLAGTGRTVTRVLPNGPGPSYLNLPAPGCWQLVLQWGAASDRLDLRYADWSRPH
jgi:hypothetical protein